MGEPGGLDQCTNSRLEVVGDADGRSDIAKEKSRSDVNPNALGDSAGEANPAGVI